MQDARLRVAAEKATKLANIEASCSQYLELLPLVSGVFSQICSECEVPYNAGEATVNPHSPVLKGLDRKLNDTEGNKGVALMFEEKLKTGEIRVDHKPNPLYFSASYNTEIEGNSVIICYRSMGNQDTYFGIGLKGSSKVHHIALIDHNDQIQAIQTGVEFNDNFQNFLEFIIKA